MLTQTTRARNEREVVPQWKFGDTFFQGKGPDPKGTKVDVSRTEGPSAWGGV